jgi:hypothetical protein
VCQSFEPIHAVGHMKGHCWTFLYLNNSYPTAIDTNSFARYPTSAMVTFYNDQILKQRTERALAYENARNDRQSNEIDTSIAETKKVVRYTMDVTGVLRGQSKAICNKDNSNALQKLLRDLKAEEDSEEGSEKGSEEGSGKESDEEGSEVESDKEFRKAALAMRAQDLLSGVWGEAVALEYDVST